ncbi:diphthine--ammonia ligase [Macadamia integrifolia]|uniref:diphthine--ammonia ligase n=1 Tax=Macadamia integrifolia TaxID=60698 RepID=UPI001C5000C2|nr:diphthine--ammonia ligase [Macadamia integrifolia]
MKVVGLVSGGKDSCYAMMKCIEYGHEIVALANLMPIDESVDELDSYMYQTVGHQIVVSYAECMGVPLFRRRIKGSPRYQNLSYKMTPDDEVEDMLILLKEIKRQIPSITAVSSGAIASDYQRLRVESNCSRLGLVSLAYLWKQDQSLLLQEMITTGIAAITVKVAAMGLDPAKHLGKEISYLQPHLLRLKESYGMNVCGEGGEYETLTLDCPLFKNARIVLDEFQIVLHSSDSIAPVGVLHPSAFHLEYKKECTFSDCEGRSNTCLKKMGYVCEVEGDCVPECEAKSLTVDSVLEFSEIAGVKLHISRSRRGDTFSIGCWIKDSSRTSEGLQKDLTAVLKRIESQLAENSFGWLNVLYIHLYIANMNEFSLANETYVRFITEKKCDLGVPSRSTIELPLTEVGLGRAYIEVLVANDLRKRVLHVQSISSWAPSCIGPYSQATLHNEILHMAGQLGLDPPTMTLCSGGAIAELEQALKNCEAVAKCFNCSIAYSAIVLIIYCSASVTSDQRIKIQERLETFLRERKLDELDNGCMSKVSSSNILYILVPDLPKRALVEIKPVLYAPEDKETLPQTNVQDPSCLTLPNYWGFQHSCWHDSCYRKCVVRGKICVVILCITKELATKICSESLDCDMNQGDCQYSVKQKDMQRITRFCVYLLDKVFLGNDFSWGDITNLRFYFPTSLCMSADMLSLIITDAFTEFSKMSRRIKVGNEPIFNVVPVLGAGQSITSMDDVITCELFATKL